MQNIFFLFCSIVFLRGVITDFFILKSAQWLKKFHSKFSSPPVNNDKPWLFLLIPVLLEQETIIPTIKYFARNFLEGNKIKLAIVTTEKEQSLVKTPSRTTHAVISSFLKKSPEIQGNVLLFHYPEKHGKMAHSTQTAESLSGLLQR